MTAAPLPADEAQRLEVLRDYEVLDTAREPELDGIAQLVAAVVGVPIVAVSLVDEDRQWFKASVGLDVPETSRDVSFCAHGILGGGLFEICDASEDPRFADNPLVTGDPKIRFYAGAPLASPSGARIGMLCAIDRRPRRLDARQRKLLGDLANHVVAHLELRKQRRDLERMVAEQAAMLERWALKNEQLEYLGSMAAHDLRGPARRIRALSEAAAEAVQTDSSEAADLLTRVTRNARELSDVTESLLGLATAEANAKPFAIADVVHSVVDEQQARAREQLVVIESDVEPGLTICAPRIRVRQILTNLVSNSIKYSSNKRAAPWVRLNAIRRDEQVHLVVADNGLGIPTANRREMFQVLTRFHPGHAGGTGLGGAIVQRHVKAMNGSIEITSSPAGTEVTVRLPWERARTEAA